MKMKMLKSIVRQRRHKHLLVNDWSWLYFSFLNFEKHRLIEKSRYCSIIVEVWNLKFLNKNSFFISKNIWVHFFNCNLKIQSFDVIKTNVDDWKKNLKQKFCSECDLAFDALGERASVSALISIWNYTSRNCAHAFNQLINRRCCCRCSGVTSIHINVPTSYFILIMAAQISYSNNSMYVEKYLAQWVWRTTWREQKQRVWKKKKKLLLMTIVCTQVITNEHFWWVIYAYMQHPASLELSTRARTWQNKDKYVIFSIIVLNHNVHNIMQHFDGEHSFTRIIVQCKKSGSDKSLDE